MKLAFLVLGTLGVLPGSASAFGTCYTVYDANNAVIYRADQSPIDLSRPISVGMAERFAGGHLVISTTSDCPPLSAAATPPDRGRLVSESPALQLADEYVGSTLRARAKVSPSSGAPRF